VLVDQIINGLVSGGLYALVALGYTLIFGVLHKLNFAHGEVFMFGGYAGLVALSLGGGIAAAVVAAAVVAAMLGIAVELVSFRKFKSADAQITAALSSLLVGLLIIEVTNKLFGTEPRSLGLSPAIHTAGVGVFGVHVAYVKLVILGTAVALMAALSLLIERTRLGRNIRTVSESSEIAALLGINVTRVTQQAFVLASALAGVSGLLIAVKNGAVVPEVGLSVGLKALAVMAIGGMGDLRGAVLAGLLLGVAEALTYWIGLGRLGEITVWILMILTLLVRPSGLLGRAQGQERRA
jgi:branched-chain amino acid transport system permease protein